MDGTRNLFVEENVAYRAVDIRVQTEREFAHISCPFVGVEDGVRLLGIVCRRFHNLAVLEGQRDVLEFEPVLNGRDVVRDGPVDAVAHGRGVNFAVGNVAMPAALHRPDPFYREGKVRAFCHNADFIRLIHQFNQRIHRFVHLAVIQAAHIEEIVLERFRAHPRKLAHSFRGIAQDDPTRLFHADVVMHLDGITLVVFLHPLFRDVGEFVAVVAAAHADVTVHLVHKIRVALRPYVEHFVACAFQHLALYLAVAYVHEGHPARGIYRLHQQGRERGIRARNVNPDLVALLHGAGIIHEIVCQDFLSVVMYHKMPPRLLYPLPRHLQPLSRSLLSRRKVARAKGLFFPSRGCIMVTITIRRISKCHW